MGRHKAELERRRCKLSDGEDSRRLIHAVINANSHVCCCSRTVSHGEKGVVKTGSAGGSEYLKKAKSRGFIAPAISSKSPRGLFARAAGILPTRACDAAVSSNAEQHRCKHALFIPIATRLRHAAIIARLAHLIGDETPAFQITRSRAAIHISQSRLLYRDMGAGAKRRHRSN